MPRCNECMEDVEYLPDDQYCERCLDDFERLNEANKPKIAKENNELTVHDIECKIEYRMELLEKMGDRTRLAELSLLMDWILCGDDY